MKYEAKTGSNVVAATTAAAGNPVASINRDDARTSCRLIGPGYDLISNAQWQTIARNIARTASNWSTGTVASGELNRGHSDNDPANSLAADASDVNACLGTNQTCSDTVWDSQRRTHTLSNGEVIWDFAGNVWEWVTDNNSAVAGADAYVSTLPTNDKRQVRYGPDPSTLCATPNASPYCGMGYAWANYSAGATRRGGSWGDGVNSGVFPSALANPATGTNPSFGFRCVFVP
jgi:formylglycine-generating enzyme required for sulfatase activity